MSGHGSTPPVRVVARYCAAEGTKPRPPWFSKRAALESLIAAGEALEAVEFRFLSDGPAPDEVAELMRAAGTLEVLPRLGNAESFRRALDVALEQPDPELVVLVEDDHIWRRSALAAMLDAVRTLPDADYVTTYEHPDYTTHEDHLTYASLAPAAARTASGSSWAPVRSTVMTFGARPHALRADRWLFRALSGGTHPMDHLIFSVLQGIGRRRWVVLHLMRSRTGRSRIGRAVRAVRGRPSVRLLGLRPGLSAHAEAGQLPDAFRDG